MTFAPFEDFVPVAPVATETIYRYESILEPAVIAMWQTHGYGIAANGFLKVIDPDYYRHMIGQYLPRPEVVPVLATGMGDVVVAVAGTYRTLQFRYSTVVAGVGASLSAVGQMMANRAILDRFLAYEPYREAAERYGPLTSAADFDYIYGYKTPLPAGGPDGVENLQRCRIFEHIALIEQFTGPISFAMAE